jgi:serine protease Do
MKKCSLLYSLLVTLIIATFVLSSCALPQFDFSWSTGTAAPTITPPATTPSPINPTYTAPSVSTNSIAPVSVLDFASIIAQVRPSVVAISTKVPTVSFFGTFTQEGAGSGWILDDTNGYIVTNNHVVDGANSITVTLEDGRNFPADMVRTDTVSDLAVLQIKADNLPKALKRGDSSNMRVGDWVIAIGNSLGQGISATKGIVSAKGVSVSADNGETLYDLIQTDAAINPGNSGGPLINLSGEVIGINSIKVAQVGVEGMGYAISGQIAFPIIFELISNGYISRPWMGVGLHTVTETDYRIYNLSVDKGVYITQVVQGGPGDLAGLQTGDIVVKIQSQDVASVEELVKIVRSYKIGSSVNLTYWRDNKKQTTSVTLGQSPPSSTP